MLQFSEIEDIVIIMKKSVQDSSTPALWSVENPCYLFFIFKNSANFWQALQTSSGFSMGAAELAIFREEICESIINYFIILLWHVDVFIHYYITCTEYRLRMFMQPIVLYDICIRDCNTGYIAAVDLIVL